ncbi:hypothetical protein RRG08_063679 [Elysia crispata]|uniref:Uncharacterized protein n=1 Tax=Elysia crispata TaxID=231223 RepID=A0AAE0ZBZ3_9GAST|nr:hypothetical protein RRG08_063679 [Elysia crispata]
MTSPYCTTLKSCGAGRVASQQVRIHWELAVSNLYAGGSGHAVARYWTEAAVEFGSPIIPQLVGISSGDRIKTKKKRVKVLNLASWNLRTLLDNINADRPERRTSLVARELARYNVDIEALSETRFADKAQLTELNGGLRLLDWPKW